MKYNGAAQVIVRYTIDQLDPYLAQYERSFGQSLSHWRDSGSTQLTYGLTIDQGANVTKSCWRQNLLKCRHNLIPDVEDEFDGGLSFVYFWGSRSIRLGEFWVGIYFTYFLTFLDVVWMSTMTLSSIRNFAIFSLRRSARCTIHNSTA